MAAKKFKSSIKVLDNGSLQPNCKCGWCGNAFTQTPDLMLALQTARAEIEQHKHLPQPKK